jgi:carbamoyltransferase
MRVLGLSFQFHDAAASVVEDDKILYASHSERYSKIKNDPWLNQEMITACLEFGKPDVIALHEKPFIKQLRNIYAGNWSALREPTMTKWIKDFYPNLKDIPIKTYWHHETHAAAGVLTSNFDECAIMVIDAIGEFDTATIWHWKDGKLQKKDSIWFPSSLGLFYSAMTAHVGLKPMEDEYVLMGMAAYGEPKYVSAMENEFFKGKDSIKCKKNLQKGVKPQWQYRQSLVELEGLDKYGHSKIDYDIAASAQVIAERKIMAYAKKAKELTGSDNLVFMGGVALNCVANSSLYDVFKNIHIMPNPGDAGSSLGAAALHVYNETGTKINWQGPYLGNNIEGPYPIKKALKSLLKGEIFGIANGKAEFGPRALGNRSLCADPRGYEIKEKVNVIKRRQEFRPFAPIILQEFVHDYFEMPGGVSDAPYMQYVAKCKKPNEFPAIVHADGTSRVQTVNIKQHPDLYKLMTKFYNKTGCPMILNTSLNIKGMPIVNDERDADEFQRKYDVPVHISD